DYLRVPDMPVRASFSLAGSGEDAGKVRVVLRYAIIDEGKSSHYWCFSKSFPELPLARSSGAVEPMLDELEFLAASFVVCSWAHSDPDTGVERRRGINFEGRCRPTPNLGMVALMLGEGPTLDLHGWIGLLLDTQMDLPQLETEFSEARKYPWELDLPGVHLQAALGGDLAIGSAGLEDTCYRIYSPLSWSWQLAGEIYAPLQGYTARLRLGAEI
ncbi:MAG: hypothetical protein KC457_36025, partial [Myxococcales bacterium]|nr:hypothetical protein [Myxococcales bacterium]